MKILVTGCAGFIGYHLCKKLLKIKNYKIFGLDNLNNYYDINLKKKRLENLNKNKKFKFYKVDINNKKKLNYIFLKNKFNVVINLAAQAGVRHSIKNPKVYFDNNLSGFFNLLDISSKTKIKHFIFASTSSVYGNSKIFPVKEEQVSDKPLSFYAATKKCNEVLAYSYSNIFNLPCTCLRFFTVYGPYGRPDMALFKFVNSIENNLPIELYNDGKHIRDFTYIDDVIEYIKLILPKIPNGLVPYNVFNIGSNNQKSLKYFVSLIKKNLNKKIKIRKLGLQKGDVYKTHADNNKIVKYVKKEYYTSIEKGVREYIAWYKDFYG